MEETDRRRDLILALNDEAGMRLNTALNVHELAVAHLMGLSIAEWISTEMVMTRGPLSAGDLARLSGLTTGAITGLIDRLEAAGMVRRVPDPKDRRKVMVEFVPDWFGRLGENPYDGLNAKFTELYGRYSDSELALLLDFMRRAAEIYDAESARLWERTGSKPPMFYRPGKGSDPE